MENMENKTPLPWEIESKKEEILEKKAEIKSNNQYLLVAAFSFSILAAAFLGFSMILEKQSFNLLASIFSIPFFFIGFLISYFLFSFGFRIFKIEEVSKNKLINYFLMISVASLLFASVGSIFKGASNQYIIYLLNFLISIFLLRYYLKLSRKRFWKAFLYLIILSVVIFIASKLLNKS